MVFSCLRRRSAGAQSILALKKRRIAIIWGSNTNVSNSWIAHGRALLLCVFLVMFMEASLKLISYAFAIVIYQLSERLYETLSYDMKTILRGSMRLLHTHNSTESSI